MSKYAVIKVGSSQERVSVCDEFSVSSSFDESTLVPVLVSPRKGQIVIDNKELKNYPGANITAEYDRQKDGGKKWQSLVKNLQDN